MAEPVLVGTVTLDLLHEGPIGAGRAPVTLRWGGVVNNAACAIGARGGDPRFVTVRYTGELSPAVGHHLAANAVRWHPLPIGTPLPVFHAELVAGSVAHKVFLGDEALTSLTPELLGRHREIFHDASVIAAGTDCDEPTLAFLAGIADECGVPFWLLSADPNEVGKLRPGGRAADLMAINLAELSLWAGRPLSEHADIVRAARRVAAPAGHCLVTLGPAGALLVRSDDGSVVFEPTAALDPVPVVVGAGDVMFGCLLAARFAGLDWPDALHEASTLTGAYLQGTEDDPYHALRTRSYDRPAATR